MSSRRYESKGEANISRLAQPLRFDFSRRTARNRMMKSSMAEGLSTWDPKTLEARGIPTEEMIELYRRWGEGGWGIIHTGYIHIDPAHMSHPGDAVIPADALFDGERFGRFQAMAAVGKDHGSLMAAQVCHPGRQTTSKMVTESISASAVQLADNGHGLRPAPPGAATQHDIDTIVASFAHAAAFLEAAGFDGINLHAAHGYLLAQFLSPTSNKRTDAYGGSVTNRARIITEICTAIRSCTRPAFILSAKLNSVEFQAEGLSTSDVAELVSAMQDAGVDYLELSGGTYEDPGRERRASTRRREAFFLEFAEKIVPALGPADRRRTKVFITAGLRTAGAMVAALDTVDGVGIARPATQEPGFARDVLTRGVTGAIRLLPPFEDDFFMGLVASSSQMRTMGRGYEPFDLSDNGVAERFGKDVQAWLAVMAEVSDKRAKYGYPDYTGKSKWRLSS